MRWTERPAARQVAAALALARAAAERRPDLPGPRIALANALAAAGMRAEAAASLTQAAGLFPREEAVGASLAEALGAIGEVDAALAETGRWDGRPWASRRALRMLTEHGRFDEATAFEPAVAAADPTDIDLLECRARRVRRSPEELLRLADEVLACAPASSHALYYRAIALAQLGRAEEAASVMGTEQFIATCGLEPPAEYASDNRFRRAVSGEILANPTLQSDPAGYTTRNGRRTTSFPLPGDRACHQLLAAIRDAIGRYAGGLSGDHAFARLRPEAASFTAWAIVLRGIGHQQLHHHPRPWLTGVYYVRAPEGTGSAGALRIGVLPPWADVSPPWPVREVAPRPGTLVLFPSFVPHETVPTHSEAERISVAFDVHRVAQR